MQWPHDTEYNFNFSVYIATLIFAYVMGILFGAILLFMLQHKTGCIII